MKGFKHTAQSGEQRAAMAQVNPADIEAARLMIEGMEGDAQVLAGQIKRSPSVKYLDGKEAKSAPAKYLRGLWSAK